MPSGTASGRLLCRLCRIAFAHRGSRRRPQHGALCHRGRPGHACRANRPNGAPSRGWGLRIRLTQRGKRSKGRLVLEVIEKGACSPSHPVPLLFVHGAWHAAWCWDEHFLDFFADRGYRAAALSLRGHGSSPTAKGLRRCSLADYVDDVAEVAARLPTQPILIGHSMGGFVVQKYLERHTAAG